MNGRANKIYFFASTSTIVNQKFHVGQTKGVIFRMLVPEALLVNKNAWVYSYIGDASELFYINNLSPTYPNCHQYPSSTSM